MTLVMFSSCHQYLKKLHMQERAIEEVKLAIKPFYQKRDINKDEYKEILRKAVQKVGSKERFVAHRHLKALIAFCVINSGVSENIYIFNDLVFLVTRCATARVGRSTQ